MSDKVILAYSGGLDTSVAIKWLDEKYHLDVIAVTIDVGNEKDFSAIRQKALEIGAIKALVIDGKELGGRKASTTITQTFKSPLN